MGVRLIVEALDHAPTSLTPRERYVLVVLAEDARDATRVCMPGIEDDEVFIRRSRLVSRTQRYRVIQALIEKGALENVRKGARGRRAEYRIPALAPSEETAEEAEKGPENWDATGPERVPESGTQSARKGPAFGSNGSRNWSQWVPKSGTPSPQSPQSPHHARTHEDPQPAGSSRPPKATKKTKTKTQKQPIDFVMDLGATETEAHAVITRLQNNHDIGNWPGFLTHATENGTLRGHLDAIRNSRRRRATVELCEDHTRDRRTCPWCPPAEQDQAS